MLTRFIVRKKTSEGSYFTSVGTMRGQGIIRVVLVVVLVVVVVVVAYFSKILIFWK